MIRPRPPAPPAPPSPPIGPTPAGSHNEGLITFADPSVKRVVGTGVNQRLAAAVAAPVAGPPIGPGTLVSVLGTVIGEKVAENAVWYIHGGGARSWSGGFEAYVVPPVPPSPVPGPVPPPITPGQRLTVQKHLRVICVNYDVPADGNRPAFKGRMSQELLDNSLNRARTFPTIVAQMTGGRVVIEQDIIVEERPVTSLNTYGIGWWIGPNDVPGNPDVTKYDGIITYLDNGVVPMDAGGLTTRRYSCISSGNVGPLADVHEWAHQVEGEMVNLGYRQDNWGDHGAPYDYPMLHSGGYHQYVDDGDWRQWNIDWLTGRLPVPGDRRQYASEFVGSTWGITEPMWRSMPRVIDAYPGVRRAQRPSDITMVDGSIINPPARRERGT